MTENLLDQILSDQDFQVLEPFQQRSVVQQAFYENQDFAILPAQPGSEAGMPRIDSRFAGDESQRISRLMPFLNEIASLRALQWQMVSDQSRDFQGWR